MVWVVLAVAATVRLGVVLTCGTLGEDRDAYIALADGLIERGQFGVFGPTAFRPPLYPFLIAPVQFFGPATSGVLRGLLNVICGVATVALVADLSGRLAMRRGAQIASGLAAVSPLAIRYCGYSMTEVVCGLLVISAVWLTDRVRYSQDWRFACGLGVVLGLGELCRPTIWPVAFGIVAVLATERQWRTIVVVAATMIVTVAPWPIRNQVSTGTPTLMTTHGGYTLALGNNDRFYDDVVGRKWGTVWTDGQQDWIDIELAIAASRGLVSETEVDAFHQSRAVDVIRRRPRDFAAACWLRLRRFWSPVPVAAEVSGPVLWTLWAYGLVVAVATLAGTWVRSIEWRTKAILWTPPLAFTAVHLVYWSNARMRLPIEPCLFVLAGLAFRRPPMEPAAGQTALRTDRST